MPHWHDKASDSSCTATTVIVALFFFVSLRTGDGNYSVVAAGTLGLDSTYLPDTGSPRNNPYYVQCSAGRAGPRAVADPMGSPSRHRTTLDFGPKIF